jgi:hypothetical protein
MAIPTNASLEAKLNARIDKQTDGIKNLERKLNEMNHKIDMLLALVSHSSDSSDEEPDDDAYAKLVEFHPAWMAAKTEREELEIACLDEVNKVYKHEENPGIYEHLKRDLHTFVSDHRGDDVPEGENRWEYLTNKWKSDLGESGLPESVFRYRLSKS